jgi:hypothetical protein
MNALISPNEEVTYLSSWQEPISPSKKYTPIFTVCGKRICQVEKDQFPVALPLFWVSCDETTSPITNCYDTNTKKIILIPESPKDPTPQPVTTGTQTA